MVFKFITNEVKEIIVTVYIYRRTRQIWMERMGRKYKHKINKKEKRKWGEEKINIMETLIFI